MGIVILLMILFIRDTGMGSWGADDLDELSNIFILSLVVGRNNESWWQVVFGSVMGIVLL